MKPIKSIDDPRFVKAMSHPLRVRILALLDERTASPNEIFQVLGGSLGTVAYHVRTLHQLGLIELVHETRVRGAVEHHYRALARPRVTDEAWAQAPPIAKQAAVGSTLQMIDEYARASAAAGGFDRPDAALVRMGLRLDREGWQELGRAYLGLLEEAERIEAAVNERSKQDPHADDAIDAAVVLMLFEAVRMRETVAGRARGRRRRAAEHR
ncbi:MAG: helix-turn-helix domain-containing protein [Actinomycetota bacterium]|nr:helix-turn-helix domain-containing protein [Actinomycetota bacterium]